MVSLACWCMLSVWAAIVLATAATHSARLEVRGSAIHMLVAGQRGNNLALNATLGIGLKISTSQEIVNVLNSRVYNMDISNSTRLTISRLDDVCNQVAWTSENITADSIHQFMDCFDLGNKHWFGGPERADQYWPYEKLAFVDYSYVTKSDNNQGIADPLWINSDGVYILVDEGVHLFIDQKHLRANHMCLIAKNKSPYPEQSVELHLKYKVCKLSNAREAHQHAVQNFLGKPTGIPDERMIQHPIWSTWARYKARINETIVLQFANEINQYGFNNSQLEIDDFWETCYGSAEFNTDKFPRMNNFSNILKNKGFRVTLWIHPFINIGCNPAYSYASKRGYFVKNTAGSINALWWNGIGAGIDFTKTEAVDWWVERLRNLSEENGIDSFKFDAGEVSWLPQLMILNVSDDVNPVAYTSSYVRAVSQFGPLLEVRSAARTQDLPRFIRMVDKDSKWGLDNGLRSLVTTLLQMNSVGYYFVLPDMIGGNVYNNDKVSKELFIRWLQANTFMPALQFSIVPWDFDQETVEISKKFTALHYQYSDTIIDLARRAARTGAPINPPIWWIDPEDSQAQAVDDEYLLGENILVAPVMTQGATSRDIYLPKGQWRDELNTANSLIQGRTWLRNYSAALGELPFFTRVAQPDDHTSR